MQQAIQSPATNRGPARRRRSDGGVGRRSFLLVCAFGALWAFPGPGASQGTPYVPGLDPAYDDLDALVAVGLVQDILVGERPHSEAAFRRFIEEAGGRLEREPVSARVREAWERLRRRFPARDGASSGLHPTTARVDVALSRSPDRPLRPGASDRLDGVLNPLLQRNHGRFLEDGLTGAFEAGLAFDAGPFAGAVTPRAYVGVPRGSGETDGAVDVQEAYARGVAGPVGLDVGRVEVSWGYGADRGAFLSDNARGLDVIRLADDRPIRLPGFLGGLGLWRGSAALADLGRDRDIPHAKALLMRLSGRPSRYVEFGFNYLNIQGGEGAPEATMWERVKDILLFVWKKKTASDPYGLFQISDKVVGADLRLSVPQARSAFYVNFLTTDDRGLFQQPAKGYWEDAVWLVGAEAKGLGSDGRWDAFAEWRHDGARAHAHSQFTSGVTEDGRVLGDVLGPNAVGVSAGLAWTGSASRVGVTGAWERYSGDDFAWDADPENASSTAWYVVNDGPDEIRQRLVLEYRRLEGWRGLEPSIRLGYEHVTRFDYLEGDRANLLAQATLRYVW